MARYISLKEYGTGNSSKNMRDYREQFIHSYQNYQKFMEYLEHLEEYKEEFKGKIPYFWGMRKNWFPLVLLGAVKDGNQQALQLFNRLVADRGCHSFYYKYLQMNFQYHFHHNSGQPHHSWYKCQPHSYVPLQELLESQSDRSSYSSSAPNRFRCKLLP